MFETKSDQGTPSLLNRWTTRHIRLRLPLLSVGQHTAYAAISFLLGFTYLNVLMLLEFKLSAAMLLFSVLGIMCFSVFVFNLIAIFTQRTK